MDNSIHHLLESAVHASVLRLFLDYDGTLADFAATPDTILPDADLIDLLRQLVDTEGILPAVISGRRLAHIQALLPVPGLILAGTYGVEMLLPNGEIRHIVQQSDVRPVMEGVLYGWQEILAEREDFYLEDKGWSVALHGRYAIADAITEVFPAARALLQNINTREDFRILNGDKFLELVPSQAGKSSAVTWVLKEWTPPGAMIIYFGDDDKDEEAFAVVKEAGGSAIRVGVTPAQTSADFMLATPQDVRTWLHKLLTLRHCSI